MRLTAWISLAALAVYAWTVFEAGRARVKYKVAAPSMEGPIAFQSAQRVQANTLEQLPMVLVPMWLCAVYLGDNWAAAGGALWCVGRILYALGYYRDPGKREIGFITGTIGSALLIVGAATGLWMH
jgi:glutathione S-transferase